MDSSEQIKKQLYTLIEASNDEARLGIVYQILNQGKVEQIERINLTEQQESELLDSFEESFDEANLIDFELLKNKHARWLEK